MNFSKHFKKYIELFFALVLLLSSYFIGKRYEKPIIFISKQETSLNINNDFLKHLNLGLKRLMSSALWVSTIIESDIDHYKNKDLNSWMFLRFNTISNLEPLFYENYAFGGPYLSIIKDDLKGASLIYDKGLRYYPDDFSLLRDSGFHYYFEANDDEKALRSYSKLRHNPQATPVMITTLARIESGNDNLEDAYGLLLNQFEKLRDKNSFMAQKIQSFLYALKAEIDLKCLNDHTKAVKNCSLIDLEGVPYIVQKNEYKAVRNWIPFKIKKSPQKM